MSKPQFVFDDAELSKALAKSIAKDLAKAAESIAAQITADTGMPTAVTPATNRRGHPVSFVTVQHPAALRSQAKHGSITKAAAELGYTTRRALPPKEGG